MARRQFWQKPSLRIDEDKHLHRPVTWLELFFDLFFVVAIAQIAHVLAGHVTWGGVIEFVLLFAPVWWAWIAATYYNERFETDGVENRLFTFLQMIPVIGFAVFAHHALHSDSAFMGYAFSYVAARLIIIVLWARASFYEPDFRPTGIRFVLGFFIAMVLAVAAAFVDPPLRYVLFGIALVIDVLSPTTTIRHQETLPKFSTSKLPERYGLFVIIVLGESVVGVVSGLANVDNPTVGLAINAIMGLAIGVGLWWIYFDFVARRPSKGNTWWAFAWAYLHFPLVMAIVAVGVGILNVIADESTISAAHGSLISGAVGIALLLIGLLELTLHRADDEPTHPTISPVLKILGAVGAICVAIFSPFEHPVYLMGSLLFLLLIQMGYGAWTWFTQEIESEPIELELSAND